MLKDEEGSLVMQRTMKQICDQNRKREAVIDCLNEFAYAQILCPPVGGEQQGYVTGILEDPNSEVGQGITSQIKNMNNLNKEPPSHSFQSFLRGVIAGRAVRETLLKGELISEQVTEI